MEVEVKLRVADAKAHQSLSFVLSPFHKQTQFEHILYFDGVASELSAHKATLSLCFFGEDYAVAKRCVVALRDEGMVGDEEEIDPFLAREILIDPNLIGSVESRVLKRVREEFEVKVDEYVCLGGFKNERRFYEWKGLRFEVDETLFDFGTLYEVECEPEKNRVLIEGLLKEHFVPYCYSNLSKFAIFRSGKLPLTTNLIGSDAVVVSSTDVSKPLWQYVTKLQKFGGGGNISFRCNYCQGIFKGSYSRVKAHLLKISGLGIKHCSEVTTEHLKEMLRLVNENELLIKKAVPLACHWPSPPASSESSSEKKAIVMSTPLPGQELGELRKRKRIGGFDSDRALDKPTKKHLDREIARMFFSAGLPFSLSKNPYFRSAFTFAASSDVTNYVPPDRSDLEKSLLKQEKAELDKWLEPLKSLQKQKGVTIVCSGWSNPWQELVNFMIAAGVPIFLKAVNCVARRDDINFISRSIEEVVMELGSGDVVQVITENSLVCREAGFLVEKAFPCIFWTPCVSHTLDLALNKICFPENMKGNAAAYRECSWITEVIDYAKLVKDILKNNTSRLSMLRFAQDTSVVGLSENRHGYVFVLLKRLLFMKDELQLMVLNENWSLFCRDEMCNAQLVKEKLLSDIFWGKVHYILSFMEPIYDMMKFVNAGRPSLHLVYEMWDSMTVKVKAAVYYQELKEAKEDSTFWNVLHQILQDVWIRNKNPLYALAHSLNPRYSSEQWLSEDLSRLPPHKDPEISSMRNMALERYFPNEKERQRVNLELVNFFESMGRFSDMDSFQRRSKLDAIIWWANYGAVAPLLQTLALKLLSQPCSSWCSDPNWGPASLGRVGKDQVDSQKNEDLLFVHMNLKSRALQQMQSDGGTWKDKYGNCFDSDSGA